MEAEKCLGASVGTHRLCFTGVLFLSYRHTFVSSCAPEEGSESRQESKEAQGGRMQHRGEGGGDGEEGGGRRRLKSQSP